MWNFKGCPKCRGDIFVDEDLDRSYEKCLQCGYERELVRVSTSRAVLKQENRSVNAHLNLYSNPYEKRRQQILICCRLLIR
jgi:hypothetical protein